MSPNPPHLDLGKRFIQLVGKGQVREMKQLLSGHPELLETRWDQRTALTEAVRWEGGNPCAKALIEAGADPNAARLDDPQFRPLRLALRSRHDLVPDLLRAGAVPQGLYPGKYRSDSVPDLVVAANNCPQHVGALIAAGADPNEHLEGDGSALGHLLHQLLKPAAHNPDPSSTIWDGVRALVEAGADLRGERKYHGPEWFCFWQLRFSNVDMPEDAPALFEALESRIDDPGVLYCEGQTFLHAIATQLRGAGRSERQMEAWKALLGRYGQEQVGAWLALAPGAKDTLQTAFCELIPHPSKGQDGEDYQELIDALEWAAAFSRAGADPNEANKQGRTLARALAHTWPWTVLLDERVRTRVGALGLRLDEATPRLDSAIDIFTASATRMGVRKPEEGEIQALILEAQSSAPACSRRSPRL